MAQLDSSPYPDDLREELAVQPRAGLSKLTLTLAAGVVLVAGIIIGIQAGKLTGGSADTGAQLRAGGMQQAPQGYGPAGVQQAPPGDGGRQGGFAQRMGGGGTIGTVEKVEGGTIYVKTMDGSTVTVTTTDQTTVQIAKPGKVSDLQAGSTITVRGRQGNDGSVAAASITQGGGPR
ncbi:DUF5666 domain-containing protein [Nonomuraea turcica]|uniref:DUF5666 domain-containing protein n=1 Tax=Nonomuraea sp. G32 TaxID=3067274 RepID=UPI00273B2C72|nr:DUF5666 domain-containing protein [Nonomuraea sp. G32]MDP4504362.1 DUF5666 domain-containing protein [Nonomuraea sp. G32]